jgi:arabinofuranan 3-O-arabinosyltransferase
VRAVRRGGWLDPLLLGFAVFTVGAVNATALAMILPAPVLVVLHEAVARRATWRDVGAAVLRIGVTCLAVSAWWIVALVVQSRHGADVLAYSESWGDGEQS